jgi:hypothetical protein
MAIYSGFTHSTWWVSIVLLVYQRVNPHIVGSKDTWDLRCWLQPVRHRARTATDGGPLSRFFVMGIPPVIIHFYRFIECYIYIYMDHFHTFIVVDWSFPWTIQLCSQCSPIEPPRSTEYIPMVIDCDRLMFDHLLILIVFFSYIQPLWMEFFMEDAGYFWLLTL